MEASASAARSVGGSLPVPPPAPPAVGGEPPSSPARAEASSPGGAVLVDGSLPPPARQSKFVLNLVPGFHFRPTDDELVVHFLRRKIAGQPPLLPIINLLEHRPDHLTYMEHQQQQQNMCPDRLTVVEHTVDPDPLVDKYRDYDEGRWFFFTKREMRYSTGPQPVQTTHNGSWKATGSVRVIYTGAGEVVGRVRTFVYYANRVGKPTDWTMYEYESVASLDEARDKNTHKLDEWVLWTIQKKQNCGKNGARKTMKRKAPSPDSSNNKGGASAKEEEVQDDSSAIAGSQEGGKERKGKKKSGKERKGKKKGNAPEEFPNAKQNADILLLKRSPAPTPPLSEPSHAPPEGNYLTMDLDLPAASMFEESFNDHVPDSQIMASPSQMMGMTNAGDSFSFDVMQHHQDAVVSPVSMEPPPPAAPINSTAFLHPEQLMASRQPQRQAMVAPTTAPPQDVDPDHLMAFLTRQLPPQAPAAAPALTFNPAAMSWAEMQSLGSSSYYVGGGGGDASVMSPISHNPFIARRCSSSKQHHPNLLRCTQHNYMAPSEFEAQNPIGQLHHHHGVAQGTCMVSYGTYANLGLAGGLLGDGAAPAP